MTGLEDPGAVASVLAWSLAAVTALALGVVAALAVWAVESVRRARVARDRAVEVSVRAGARAARERRTREAYVLLAAHATRRWRGLERHTENMQAHTREKRRELGRMRSELNLAEGRERVLRTRLGAALQADSGGCGKGKRLPDESTAWRFAESLAYDVGIGVEELGVYRCKRCPPQPVTHARWWHAYNLDPAERTSALRAGNAPGRRESNRKRGRDRAALGTLGDRIDPGVAARLGVILKPEQE